MQLDPNCRKIFFVRVWEEKRNMEIREREKTTDGGKMEKRLTALEMNKVSTTGTN
jgi:hypothetical protein